MNVDEIRHYCMSFPGVTEKLQWGDALCFKVREKMFAVLGLDQLRFTFKCAPEVFAELMERQDIRPAPYVGRYHWVMLDRLDALNQGELRELVRRSYEIVAAKAPRVKERGKSRKRRPTGRNSRGKRRG
jgi:predicted DNA-binding protein (MmcQ/YjbR family)